MGRWYREGLFNRPLTNIMIATLKLCYDEYAKLGYFHRYHHRIDGLGSRGMVVYRMSAGGHVITERGKTYLMKIGYIPAEPLK